MLNKAWKKSAAIAALGIAILTHAGAASAATPYKAKEGDTFWNLAKRFGVQVEQLKKANPAVNPLNIYGGLTLSIPAPTGAAQAKKSAPAAKTAAAVHAFAAAPSGGGASQASDKDTVTVNGKTFGYSDVVQAKASAYTAAASENGGWGPVDYFGNPLKLGTVAVDPNRIPLGSKLYITGYDHDGLPVGGMIAVAADMGGAIKGDRIDIFLPQSQQKASEFGFQYVKVFVLN